MILSVGVKLLLGQAFGGFWGILKQPVNLPIGVLLGAVAVAGVWLHFDKSSAVRAAVNDLVAGYELDSSKAQRDGLAQILKSERLRLAIAEAAAEVFAKQLAEAERKNEDLENEINELLLDPLNPDGLVDGGLVGRLRNN